MNSVMPAKAPRGACVGMTVELPMVKLQVVWRNKRFWAAAIPMMSSKAVKSELGRQHTSKSCFLFNLHSKWACS
jgi:hypothetical protein